jgi:hypothetical protein
MCCAAEKSQTKEKCDISLLETKWKADTYYDISVGATGVNKMEILS